MIVSRNAAELVTASATAAAGALVCYGSLENGVSWGASGPEPGYFPFYVGCLIILGSAGAAVQALWRGGTGEIFADGENIRTVAAFLLPLIALAALSQWLGLYIAMALYLFFAVWLGAKRTALSAFLIAAITTGVNFVIFEILFTVPLLKGPVLEYFGIY
ncbi:tripartite tricarboxylate transporter TctB family protein [Chenggangzhangella methanolivorans]|uniref:Tripartite tricarboxylate transporter TctB family protein n=1 Tax=Chenggangzhangella methanolivorans TaxID=1437009 RepID=A0A9E6UMB0_9HYPH|nr:tripartite tricarboxylate transporter TctB family protein [Chenggangzhangella methanolivorans]QZO01487.1 tripartite tricarboxylate transporter TctB family protein [Chenggangzhangella methanolivorans]